MWSVEESRTDRTDWPISPGPPWPANVRATIWWHRARATDLGPRGAQTIPITMGMVVDYLSSPIGPYREILVSPVLRRDVGRIPRMAVPFIAVDSATSVHGGRTNWHLPKVLAEFGGDVLGAATVGSNTPGSNTPGPNTLGPNAAGPNTAGPNTAGPNTVGPNTAGPNTPGSSTPGSSTPGPSTPGPSTAGPNTAGPNTPGPNTPGSSTPGPSAAGPNTDGRGTPSSITTGTDAWSVQTVSRGIGPQFPMRGSIGFAQPVDGGSLVAVARLRGKARLARVRVEAMGPTLERMLPSGTYFGLQIVSGSMRTGEAILVKG